MAMAAAMTTSRQFADHEGDFGPEQRIKDALCPKCHIYVGAIMREWDSSDGAYTDYQFKGECGHTWWIDGIDA